MAIGSITFKQEPVATSDQVPVITNWTPVVPYTVHQDDISGLFYFKLILAVYTGSAAVTANLIAKIKQRRNGYAADITADEARAVFDLRAIINSSLDDTTADLNVAADGIYTTSIHTLGDNLISHPFSQNNNQIAFFYVKAFQEYSTDAASSPSEFTTPTVNDTRLYMRASLPLNTGRGTSDFQTYRFNKYQMDGSASHGLFLSDVQLSAGAIKSGTSYRNYVQDTDYHTLGFLNGKATDPAATQELDSNIRYIKVSYYDSDNAQILSTQTLSQRANNGGCMPLESDGELASQGDPGRLIYLGCGPANLEAQNEETLARPSNFSGWAYYKIVGTDVGGGVMSQSYYFFKQDGSCKGFKVRRLAWINSLGCWDYFNFKMKSSQTLNVEKNEYETMLGEFSGAMYQYNNFGRGKNTRSTSATLEETLNTDWITEQDAELLENLIMSRNVQIIENADTTYTVPVMVKDKSIVRKTSANDGVKIQYTIKIEYANPINTNS